MSQANRGKPRPCPEQQNGHEFLDSAPRPQPGSPTAIPASGLCETNSPLCLSQLEQTEQMVPNEDKCKVIVIPHLLPLCVCVLSEGLFNLTPEASLFTRWR